jgi:hypothetical protein
LIKGLYLYLKDKEFYLEHKEGILKKLGNIGVIRDLIKRNNNIKLLHIIDQDLNRGTIKNFDLYDSLTTFIHVQVETSNLNFAKKLQSINVRTVILPPYENIDELNKRFLALRIDKYNYKEFIDKANDIVTSNNIIASLVIEKQKRLFFIGFHEKAFCSIYKNIDDLNSI